MRPISAITEDVYADWKKLHYTARPYLEAMRHLGTFKDKYYQDDAEGIVLRFLANAQTWRGPVARAIKQELKDGLAEFRKARKEERNV